MADLQKLISDDELHWDYLFERVRKQASFLMRYDDLADMLLLLFVSPDTPTVVHFVSDDVALLVDPSTRNVVGFQIEGFKTYFLPEHEYAQRAWLLSETGVHVQGDYGDLLMFFNGITRNVAREVIRATEDTLGEPAAELVEMLV